MKCGDIEKEFISMIQNDDCIDRFMVCTPFSTDNIYTYSGELTPSLFFEKLYVESNKNGKKGDLESKVINNIRYNTKNTVYILGNKGCGKTIFVNNVIRKIQTCEEIKYVYLDFGDSNSTLDCASSQERIWREIYKRIKSKLKDGEFQFLNEFYLFYVRNQDDIDTYWDKNGEIDSFFKKLKSIIDDKNGMAMTRLKAEIRNHFMNFELYQLFLVLTLLELFSQMNMYGEILHTAFILDNLDNMISISEVQNFILNYNNFVNAIGKMISDIKINEGKNYIYRFTFLLVMREITKAYNATPHYQETNRLASVEHDLTEYYPKKEIAKKRIDYMLLLFEIIESDPGSCSSLPKEEIENLKLLAQYLRAVITDTYIHKTIFPLYNNDYREVMLSLAKLCSENRKLIDEYISMMGKEDAGAKYGARGIIYRIVLNLFRKRGYFKDMQIVDFNDRKKHVSLSRLILTYLNNTTCVECTDESPSVSLKELLVAFKDYPSEDVIECLWAMYNLINVDDWNHLITFASSKYVSKEQLYNERNFVESDPENYYNYSMFRITCAGKIYLTNICTHYEFFACRIYGRKYMPLFSVQNLKKSEDTFGYKKIVEEVFREAKECCKELNQNVEQDGGICSDLHSYYNFRAETNASQYHSERIVFSHIGYLDTYRCYVLRENVKLLEQNGETILGFSLFLIKKIENYMSLLLQENAKCSYYGKSVLNSMREVMKGVKLDPTNPNLTINLNMEDK